MYALSGTIFAQLAHPKVGDSLYGAELYDKHSFYVTHLLKRVVRLFAQF